MSQVSAITTAEEIPERQRLAILTLLADEDPAVYQKIRRRIISCGPSASEWLRPHLLSGDPVLRRRTKEITLWFEQQAADDRFLAFCLRHGEDLELETGAWLLAQTQYPGINIEAYQALLDAYAEAVREQAGEGHDRKDLLTALNSYLFHELGFAGNEDNYYDPENSYLNRVLDRRAGNPINLCLVYLLLARRLSLPVAGIGLPGHFICRYQSSAAELYIDAFNRGKLLSKGDCVQYLLRTNHCVRHDYFAPLSSRQILLRICGNLRQIYLNLEQGECAMRLQRYLVALSR